jgi:hypothetical protein
MRRASSCALAAALLAIALPAVAQAPSAEERERLRQAKQWFEEGVAAEKAGDCDTAVDRFIQALEVKQTPQLHLRIGLCLEKLGQLMGAREAYVSALDLPIDNAKLETTLETQLAELVPRIPRLVVRVRGDVRDVALRVDGREAKVGEPVEVDPGQRKIVAEAPGHRRLEALREVVERDEKEVEISLEKLDAPTPTDVPASPPPEPAHGEHRGPWPWFFVGGGAVAIGAGIGLFVAAGGPLGDADALCGGERGFCQAEDAATRGRIDDLVGEANLRETLGTVAIVAGTGLAATGVVLLLLPGEGDAARDEATSLHVTPWAAPSGGGFVVGGRF